jgi:hypothetical protein
VEFRSEIQSDDDRDDGPLLLRAYGEACSGKASKPNRHDDSHATFSSAGTFSSVISAVHQNLQDTLYHSDKPRMQVRHHPHLKVMWHVKQPCTAPPQGTRAIQPLHWPTVSVPAICVPILAHFAVGCRPGRRRRPVVGVGGGGCV